MVVWSVLAPLGLQDVTFILQGPPKPVPLDLDILTSSRCGWLKQGMKGWSTLQFPYSEQIKAAAKTVACVYLWWEGTDFDFREEEMCRRFDLWGSEHENYFLPSKKLTTALRTSKHLFPFHYINKCKQMLDGYIYSPSSLHPKPSPILSSPCFFACSNVTQQTVHAAESHAIALEMLWLNCCACGLSH